MNVASHRKFCVVKPRPLVFFISIMFVVAVTAPVSLAQVSPAERRATGSVSGKITADGKPATGIVVWLASSDHHGIEQSTLKTRTDSQGRFQITNVPWGRYRLLPIAPTYLKRDKDFWFIPSEVVEVEEGEEVKGIDLELIRGGVITGRVTDAAGQPIRDEAIQLMRFEEMANGSWLPQWMRREFKTDDRGIYRCYTVPPGRYIVSIRKSIPHQMRGHEERQQTRIYHPGVTDQEKAKIVEVTAGGESTDVDIEGISQENDRLFQARGRVVDAETGQGVSGVECVLRNKSAAFHCDKTDAKGEFVIAGLPPGRFLMNVTLPEQSGIYSDAIEFEITDHDVTGLVLKAIRGSRVSGKVILEGQPGPEALAALASAKVSTIPAVQPDPLEARNAIRSAEINPDGSFQLAGLRPGVTYVGLAGEKANAFKVTRVEPQGAAQPGIIEVAGEYMTDVRIYAVYLSAKVRGQIRVVGGTPPPGTRLKVYYRLVADERNRHEVDADASGKFLIEHLAPGDYEVTASLYLFPSVQGGPMFSVSTSKNATVTNESETELSFVLDLRERVKYDR